MKVRRSEYHSDVYVLTLEQHKKEYDDTEIWVWTKDGWYRTYGYAKPNLSEEKAFLLNMCRNSRKSI